MSSAESPLRFPDTSSPDEMTKRAWTLFTLNFVLPGSAQLLAGNRKLGQIGFRATLALLASLILMLLIQFVWRGGVFSFFTSAIGLWIVALAAVFFAGLWLILTVDTLRLSRLVNVNEKSKIAIAILAVVSIVLFSGGALLASNAALTTNVTLAKIFETGPPQDPIDGRYNFLLLGSDAGADREGTRPDSTMVVSVDAATGRTVTISLPRDLHNIMFPAGSVMAGIYPNGYNERTAPYCSMWACLNTVYVDAEERHEEAFAATVAKGTPAGVSAMMEAAEGVTGLKMQYYVLVDLQGFQNLVDALGGVYICVEKTLPIVGDESSEPVGYVQEGCRTLNGYDALWYARARHQIVDGDYGRIARQNNLLNAIKNGFTPTTVLARFQDIASAGTQVVTTSIPQSMVGYLADLATKAQSQELVRVELVPENDVDPQDPDYEWINSLIQLALYPPSPVSSG